MRAGDLRRRITIQSRDMTQDAAGQQALTWTDYLAGVPCDIQPLIGRELFAAQAAQSEATHTLILRYTDLLADPIKVAGMRAVYVNAGITRYFNLTASLDVDERNRQITVVASEGLKFG